MIIEFVSYCFLLTAIGGNMSQFVYATDAESSVDNNIPVCVDSSRLIEMYQLCIDNSGADTNFDNNDVTIAIRSLNDMIAECPQDQHHVRMVRASCFAKEDKLSEAISDYEYVLSSNPTLPYIHREIGSIYHRQGKYEEAIREFTIEINMEFNSYRDYIYRARVYKEIGNRESALSDYRVSLRLLAERTVPGRSLCKSCYSPIEVDIYLEMGSMFEQDGDVQEAISLYRKGLENNPGSLKLQDKLKWMK